MNEVSRQHSCCQHFIRFQIRSLQRDSRHRVFHNFNGVFRNRRLSRCLSWMEIENNLHVTQHDPSGAVRSVCVRPKKLISSVPATAPAHDCHQCFQLVDFGPDVSNCEFRGFIDTSPQLHFSRFRHGCHIRRLSRNLCSHSTLTRVSHLVVWPLWRQPAHSP